MITQQIFIGGCPRSGTTLLGALLGNLSDAVTTPESQFKFDIIEGFRRDFQPEEIMALVASHRRFLHWGIGVPPNVRSEPGEFILEIVRNYANSIGVQNPRIWIDHTPENLLKAEDLRKVLPDARFIHVVRDGRAVWNSVRTLDWGPVDVQEGAPWWNRWVSDSHESQADFTVHFEDLVRSPRSTLESISSTLKLDHEAWPDDATGNFRVPSYTAEQHTLVTKSPDMKRAVGWRSELPAREIWEFERLAGDGLEQWGYAVGHGESSYPRLRGWFAQILRPVRKKVQSVRRRHRERRAANGR